MVNGILVATRSVLEAALDRLPIEELRILHQSESGTLADLTRLWSSRGSLSVYSMTCWMS